MKRNLLPRPRYFFPFFALAVAASPLLSSEAEALSCDGVLKASQAVPLQELLSLHKEPAAARTPALQEKGVRVTRGRVQPVRSTSTGRPDFDNCPSIPSAEGQVAIYFAVEPGQTFPIGYRVTLQSGNLPAGVSLPTDPVLVFDGSQRAVILSWADGATAEQEPLSFVLRITAVGSKGEESEPLLVTVVDPGTPGGTTAAGNGGATAVQGSPTIGPGGPNAAGATQAAPAPSGGDDGGCSVGGSAPTGNVLPLAGLMIAGLVARRRPRGGG